MLGSAEDLVALGRYEEARINTAKVMADTRDAVYRCVAGFVSLTSHVLEGTSEVGVEWSRFVRFYAELPEDWVIGDRWMFRGIRRVISESRIELGAKSLLVTLLGLIHGKIDRSRFLKALGSGLQ